MAGRTKIVDMAEVLRWIAEGKTYRWMSEEYLRKYDVQISLSTFATIRSRRGIDTRDVADEALVPWKIHPDHAHAYPPGALRMVGRLRAGRPMSPHSLEIAEGFLRSRARTNTVVAYDPVEGFSYVTPRPGIDVDLIRVPDRVTRRSTTRLGI